MRILVKMGVVLAATVALSACGSASPSPKVTRAPVDLSSGFAEVAVPLAPRQSPLIVAAGDHVVVFGGSRVVGSRHLPRRDGADYDIARGEWTQMPSPPFDRALHLAAGVWTGRDVIVVGTPCGSSALGEEIYDAHCDHAAVEAAAYSPQTKTWRTLDGPSPALLPQLAYGSPFLGAGEGWTGRAALFGNDTGDRSREHLLYDVERSSWRFLPAFGNADAVCPVAGGIVAVVTGERDAGGGSGTATPQILAAPLQTIPLTGSGTAWGPPVSTPKPESSGAMFESVNCSAGQLGYFPVFPGPVGVDRGALWYHADTRSWEVLPRLGPTNTPSVGPVAAFHSSKAVVVGDAPGQLYLLAAGSTTWARREDPMRGRWSELDGLIMVVPFEDARQAMKVGLLNPERYVSGSVATPK